MYRCFFAILVLLVVTSCSLDPCLTKGQYVNAYNTFHEKVSEEHTDFSRSDWREKDDQMDHFIEHCYKKYEDKLTDSEKKEIWVDYFKYKFHRHGRTFLSAIEDDVEEFSLNIEAELEDIFDNPEEDVELILKELYGDDVKEALDEFVDGIGTLAESIKEWIDSK